MDNKGTVLSPLHLTYAYQIISHNHVNSNKYIQLKVLLYNLRFGIDFSSSCPLCFREIQRESNLKSGSTGCLFYLFHRRILFFVFFYIIKSVPSSAICQKDICHDVNYLEMLCILIVQNLIVHELCNNKIFM